jgi:SAM-dependent methyltransferase
MYYKKLKCRICPGNLTPILDLGQMFPSAFLGPDEQPGEAVPLELCRCTDCGLVQLQHTYDRDAMYRHYYYRSGLNPSMVTSLRDVVTGIRRRLSLQAHDIILDIGANDGTLLGLFPEYVFKIGVDPARNLVTQAQRNCQILINDYFEMASDLDFYERSVDVITSIAMFYDLDEPNVFVEKVAQILAKTGLWVIQMTDFISMIKANAFDNICHEHLEYYSLKTTQQLLDKHGLEIFDIETNEVNGGSVRLYVGHRHSWQITRATHAALQAEHDYMMTMADPIKDFGKRVERVKVCVRNYLTEQVKGEGKVYALGASTKGNTLLQYFGLDHELIKAIADINSDKYGKFTVGTRIPIVPENTALNHTPGLVLVLPWHFKKFLLNKHAEYLDRGGLFLFPLPIPHLVGYKDGEIWQQDWPIYSEQKVAVS